MQWPTEIVFSAITNYAFIVSFFFRSWMTWLTAYTEMWWLQVWMLLCLAHGQGPLFLINITSYKQVGDSEFIEYMFNSQNNRFNSSITVIFQTLCDFDEKKWTNGHISQTITLTDIIPGTKVQYNKRHLMTWAFLTMT